MAKQKEREITSVALTELEFITLYEAFQIAPMSTFDCITLSNSTWLNDKESLVQLSEKLDKILEKILGHSI